MERFVRLIVGGGVTLVAGLWITAVSGAWSNPWFVGVVLVFLGGIALLAGIGSEVRVRRTD